MNETVRRDYEAVKDLFFKHPIIYTLIGVYLLLLFIFPGLPLVSWFWKWLNVGITSLGLLIPGILLFVFSPGFTTRRQRFGVATVGVLLGIAGLLVGIFSHQLMLMGLYHDTEYVLDDKVIPVNDMRPVSYSEALRSFENRNPENQYGPSDLDYVRGRWVSVMAPTVPFNQFFYGNKGVFIYEPNKEDKVTTFYQSTAYSEKGLFHTSYDNPIMWHNRWAEYHEIIYIEDFENGGFMGVVSLISRHGFFRVPYVSEVGIIHADGSAEWLTPAEAVADSRLSGVQLAPEWLVEKRVEAYGWRENFFSVLVSGTGRIQVQSSTINSENSAPYLMSTHNGSMWFVPYGPLDKLSMTGIMYSPARSLNNRMVVWALPPGQAYQGMDDLANEIKGVPRSTSVNWVRVSNAGSSGEVRSGDTDIIELLPIARHEGSNITVYFVGYVSTDPPTTTKFYVIINPATGAVYRDVQTLAELNRWIDGDFELPIQSKGTVTSTTEYSGYTTQQLWDALHAITAELERRTPQ